MKNAQHPVFVFVFDLVEPTVGIPSSMEPPTHAQQYRGERQVQDGDYERKPPSMHFYEHVTLPNASTHRWRPLRECRIIRRRGGAAIRCSAGFGDQRLTASTLA